MVCATKLHLSAASLILRSKSGLRSIGCCNVHVLEFRRLARTVPSFQFKSQEQWVWVTTCDVLERCCELEGMHRNDAVVIC
jgi:hypothetical protein